MRLNTKENITRNMLWRLLERFGAQGVSFVVSIILARLLDPSVYGIIALVTVFISILQVFIDSGLGLALIQKKDANETDFSTVFYFNIVFCLLLYTLIFLVSPLVAGFYNLPELTLVLRVLSLSIVISGVKNVQQAYVSRNLIFRKFFFSTLGGTLGAAVVGIVMAYRGFGVWALVTQSLFNTTVDTLILWITVKWRPQKAFSWHSLKGLYAYGWKLLLSRLIDTVYEDVRSLVIGKMYSSTDLAYYNRGKQIPQLLVGIINSSIESVLFPSLSMEQDYTERVRAMTSRSIKTLSYIIMPMMVGLAVCSESLVNILLTPKWADAVPFMRIFCIGLAIVPISLANLNAIKAIGRSDIYLKLEIIRKTIGTVSLLISMWFGVKMIAYSYLINCVINLFVNANPNKRLLQYGYIHQLKDLLPAILLSSVMGLFVFFVSYAGFSDWITLLIQVILGIAIYYVGSRIFKIDSYKYLLELVKGFRERGNT